MVIFVIALCVLIVLLMTRYIQKRAELKDVHVPYGPYEALIKRPLDIMMSIFALIILSPLFLCTAVLVRIKLGPPIFFSQERPGRIDQKTGRERIFSLYKFRTMTDARDEAGNLLPDEQRLTSFGNFLRATSVDELGELLNVIRGDMSLIGPRPLLTRYLPYYTTEERHRHDVRPGLTGVAQVNGRNFLSWEERFALDVSYVNKITFWGDVKIIIKTIVMVFMRKDVMRIDEDKKNMSFDDLDRERKNKLCEKEIQ